MHAEGAAANVTPIVWNCISARSPSSELLTCGRQGHDYVHHRVGLASGRLAICTMGYMYNVIVDTEAIIGLYFCDFFFFFSFFKCFQFLEIKIEFSLFSDNPLNLIVQGSNLVSVCFTDLDSKMIYLPGCETCE